MAHDDPGLTWQGQLRPPFPAEAQKQFGQLLTQFESLAEAAATADPSASKPACDAIVAQLKALAPADRWWTDLAQLELCVADYLPEATVRARVYGWRRQLREVGGEARYAAYLACNPPPSQTAALEDVRADLIECMRSVYYLYGSYGVAASSRDRLIRELLRFGGIIIALECVVAVLLFQITSEAIPWLTVNGPLCRTLAFATVTSMVAVVGSIVSVQRRLEDPTVDADPYFRYIQTSADRLSVSFSAPFFGAVFGYVLFGLVASKLFLGTVINVTTPDVVGTTSMLVLGFTSGFAEQLIPDALTRVASRALGTVTGGGSQSPPPAPPMQNAPATNGTGATPVAGAPGAAGPKQ